MIHLNDHGTVDADVFHDATPDERAALDAAKTTRAQSAAEDRAREARKSQTRNDT